MNTAAMDFAIRPMTADDVVAADSLWREAFREVPEMPQTERTPETIALDHSRFRHLLATDPGGSFVAELEGQVAGFCQTHRREQTFVLGMLGVHPEFQNRGIGRTLLERALAYGEGSRDQYIFSSMDPRALHRYVSAGFTLHPTVFTASRDATTDAAAASALEAAVGSEQDVAFVSGIDRSVRGSARPVDVEFWLRSGQRLLLDPEGGYAVVGPTRLSALAAHTEEVARRLLRTVLTASSVELNWIAAEQQWAIEEAVALGRSLRVRGALMSRGLRSLPVPYLPNGFFG